MAAEPGQSSFIQSQIYPDAVLRAGDCAFKRAQYDIANQYYNEAINKKYPGSDYAEFQNAIIKGLQNKPAEKIQLMEEMVRDIPQSVWADDALFQIGDTYQDQSKIDEAIKAYEATGETIQAKYFASTRSFAIRFAFLQFRQI
jgi:TolA-binding protein